MTRSTANRALAVGVLVALAGMAFVVAITFFRKGGYSEKESYVVHAYFKDATGLTWKSRVQIAGIQIGEVDEITLERDRARLDLRIKKGITLHTNACLTKTFPSALLPDALLETAPGSDPAPALEDLPVSEREIKCIREATTLQQLTDTLASIAQDVQAVTGDLRATVGSQQGSLREIIENVSSITRSMESLLGAHGEDLSAIVRNARDFTGDLSEMSSREKDRVHTIAVNLEDVSRQLRDVLAGLSGVVDGGGEGAAPPEGAAPLTGPGAVAQAPGGPGTAEGRGVRQAVDRLNASMVKLDDILGKVSEGKSTVGKLLVDERMGRQVGDAVEGVTNYLDNLVRMQLEVNLRSEWLLNQVGAKTYFGIRILPRPDKY